MGKPAIKMRPQVPRPDQWKAPTPRRPPLAGLGRARKIAIIGGARTIRFVPWHDPTWELWSHASCRDKCAREPDVLFDIHPPELWKNPKNKWWDPTYYTWLQQNHLPIYMQEHYPEVPASIRFPFEQMVTEFPRGYMTNSLCYMVALALMEGVTHVGIYGCHYDSSSEYAAQRGCAEYWLGLAEGRGVQVLIPPGCDLLNRPSLIYGYESHPNGIRHDSYLFYTNDPSKIGPAAKENLKRMQQTGHLTSPGSPLTVADDPQAPPLMDIGVPPALERRDSFPIGEGIAAAQERMR